MLPLAFASAAPFADHGGMRGIIFAVALALTPAACATSGPNKGEFNLISMDQEMAIGKQFDQELRSQKRVIDDPATTGYLQDLTDRMAKGAGKNPPKFTVRVVADPAVNAFAAPGNQLYVNSGLVQAAGTESELAGVMAHEMAHAVERHVTEQMSKMYGMQILGAVALGENPGLVQQLVAQLGGTAAMLKFGRDAERESDRLAVRYTTAANIDPKGLVTFFQKLKQQEGKGGPPGFLAFLSTHPLTNDRIKATNARIAEVDRRGMTIDTRAFRAFKERVSQKVAVR